MAYRIDFKENEINDILDKFNNLNFSIRKLAMLYNHDVETIRNLLINNGISDIKKNSKHHLIKYDFNHDYFENIDTENKAYWLGFLYADGCVTNKNSKGENCCLLCTLSSKDKLHLEKFLLEININNLDIIKDNIINNKYKTSGFTLTSKKMCFDLINKGLTPNKTYSNNSYIFTNLDDKLKWEFIRGFFDGDGTLCKSENKFIFGFVSLNENLLYEILSFVKKTIKTKSILKKDGKYFRITISGNRIVKQFCEYIYKNSNENNRLNRKYELSKTITTQDSKYKYNLIYKRNKQNDWISFINFESNRYYIGLFENEYEAVVAYNKKADELNLKKQIWIGGSFDE